MSEHLFVAPFVYPGTSFEQISDSVQHVVDAHELPIDIARTDAPENNLPPDQLDDRSYITAQLGVLDRLLIDRGRHNKYLFVDFFNPGLDLIRYSAEQEGRPFASAALLHGATFMEGDLYDEPWQSRAEQLWGAIYDRVYVPSRCAFAQLPGELQEKARVHPWGMDAFMQTLEEPLPRSQRDIDVVFPHRLSEDKGIGDLVHIARQLPDVTFVATSPSNTLSADAQATLSTASNIELAVCRENYELNRVLGRSIIVLSCAYQELFGYSVAEAYVSGCVPVLPNRQVYPELYAPTNLYTSTEDCAGMIEAALAGEGAAPDPQTLQAVRSLSIKPLIDDFLTL